MAALIEFIRIMLSNENKMNNSDIQFTQLDDDTVTVENKDNPGEQVNVRVFTQEQIDKIKNAGVVAAG